MTDRELMQQALEALELLAWYENPATSVQVRKPRNGGPIVTVYPHKVATEAAAPLRERLAQPQRTHWEGCEEVHPECRKPERPPNCGTSYCSCIECVMEQPEQEPVAWVTGWHDGHCVIRAANPSAILPIGIALYTAPPRRELVGLTEAEKVNVAIACGCADVAWMDFADAIEAKLKEKNI